MKTPIYKSNILNNNIKKSPKLSSYEHRKVTKPLMERRRRARINKSLDQIKCLILEACNKDPARHTKLEKADILEMTVQYLQSLHKDQKFQETSTLNNYRDGFKECATEVTRFVQIADGISNKLKHRLILHLSNSMQSITPVKNSTTLSPSPIINNNSSNDSLIDISSGSINVLCKANLNLISTFLNQMPKISTKALSQTPFSLPNDDNNNFKSIEMDLSTPPSSADSVQYSFKFPPIVNNQNQLLTLTTNQDTSSLIDYVLSSNVQFQNYIKEQSFSTSNVWRPW